MEGNIIATNDAPWSLGVYAGGSQLYRPLTVDPVRFMEAYNLDIEAYIERNKFRENNQAKDGGAKKEIWYLSHSHALRLLKTKFPELSVQLIENPETGGFIFKEIDGRGYFLKGFLHDGVRRTQTYYYPVLSNSGQAVLPDDRYPDKKDKETGKVYAQGKYMAETQLFSKSIWRGEVRFIAFATGIGLKLWTGDDLSSDVQDAKMVVIDRVFELAEEYKKLSGVAYVLPELNYMTPSAEIKKVGTELSQAVKELRNKPANIVEDVPLVTSEPEIVDIPAVEEPTKPSRSKKAAA
jgi:hypothetical protein